MREDNSSRDIHRFIRLPLDINWVRCPYKVDPNGPEIVETNLPVLDPHELVDYVWRTGRVTLSPETISMLG